ncbi:MAG: Fic/DOC family N-terminal domain-containing protein, partial [Clostridiaceae bacterium]
LKQLAITNRALAELKGYADTIPNKHILINAINLNEAKDSSEIEQIIATHDDLYKALSYENAATPAAKEVVKYRSALWHGYELVKKRGILTINMLVEIQELIEKNKGGIRKLPGTELRNALTGEIIYTPPQSEQEVREYLSNLELYINDDIDGIDPLIKLAVVHYQFEAIHPFYDGNGRTGRILNVLFLVLKELLDSPILYLSKYILENKSSYYKLLKGLQDNPDDYEEWVLFILYGIEKTSVETLKLVKSIIDEMTSYSDRLKEKLPSLYSKELLELLFFEFYTKIQYIEQGLRVSRKTAQGYLKQLEENGFLSSQKIGRERIYCNDRLFRVVKESSKHRL